MKSKKLLSFILAAATVISLFLAFAPTASAATAEKNIMLGTSALRGYDSASKSYKYIYYGAYNNAPVK